MSNVRIEAIGETGLEVDVVLGSNERATHEVPGGDAVELAVGGGQRLRVRAAANVAPTAELPVGVDVDEDAQLAEMEQRADAEAAASREFFGAGEDLFAGNE